MREPQARAAAREYLNRQRWANLDRLGRILEYILPRVVGGELLILLWLLVTG
jgi:hypothetical protein